MTLAMHSLKSLRLPSRGVMRLLGGLLSLGALIALAALLSRGDWRDLIRPLAQARLELLAAAVALALSVEVVKTVRWQLLLGMGLFARPEMVALVLSARLLNAVAPLRAGDLWRVASAARLKQGSFAVAGGSVLAEKLFDGAALGGVSLSLLWPASADTPRALFVGVALVAGVGVALGVGLLVGERVGLGRWTARARHVRSGRVLAGVALLTVAGMGLGLLVNISVLHALGLPDSLTLGVLMLVSGYAAGLVPSGPAQLGVFELAVAAPLMAAGVPPASSVATAVALHMVLLAMLGVGGLISIPLGLLGARQKGEDTNG